MLSFSKETNDFLTLNYINKQKNSDSWKFHIGKEIMSSELHSF